MDTSFDPLWFNIGAMVIVYLGMTILFAGLYFMAKSMNLFEKIKASCSCCSKTTQEDKGLKSEDSSKSSSSSSAERQNMILAVATALYLEQSRAGDMKLTGERFEAFDSTWKLGGRVQGMRPLSPWQNNLSRRM